MKRIFLFVLSLALLSVIGFQPSTAFAQGNLTPPGAPAPTMRTLDQISQQITNVNQQVTNVVNLLTNQISNQIVSVEKRYPIFTFQTNLTVSGSYYLTTNLVSGTNTFDAILVHSNASNVTIDLNGFSLICTIGPSGTSSPAGVRVIGATNIVIRNGQITGFDRGVRAEEEFCAVVCEDLHVHGCRRAGIEANGTLGSGLRTITVRHCVIEKMDSTGEATDASADGVTLLSCAAVVENCVIRDIVAAGTAVAMCIDAISPTNTFIDNNFLSNADIGLKSTGSGTRVYYRNNLTSGITTPFSATGGVDRGGNF